MNKSYSRQMPNILEKKGRLKQAKKIITVLKKEIGDLSKMKCLDIGCSNGLISNELSKYFSKTIAIDIDRDAIKDAKNKFSSKNLMFLYMDSTYLKLQKNSFDVVICNQVYEFVDNQEKLISHIYRVLKKDGICYMGARNKFALIEGQTGVPFLHFLPKSFQSLVTKLLKINYYPPTYLSLQEQLILFKKFKIINLSTQIIKNPEKYKFTQGVFGEFLSCLPTSIINHLLPIIPNYIFLLRK